MAKEGGRVLVVDDDAAVGLVLAALLQQAGMRAEHVASGPDALRAMQRSPADVVITDLRMPGMDGLALLSKLSERYPGLPVIVLTAHGTVPIAVDAMRAGAADFLLKPFDREQIVFVVKKAMMVADHDSDQTPAAKLPPAPFASVSPAMREAAHLIGRAARGTATVLLRGETGTGKEVAAKAIHEASARRVKPFVALHCAALPASLLESELFGYEKGAFTGAACRKPGRIELANGGTLFLDEIGDVAPEVQVKLLRVLQERQFERLGGAESVRVDVRFIAATHRDLEAMVRTGEFREDLFYRLNVVPIVMPPLRARTEDIAEFVVRFARALGAANGRPEVRVAEAAVQRLKSERWPGNVRQLQNFIERLIVLTDGDVISLAEVERELARATPAAAPRVDDTGDTATLDAARRESEREAVVQALARAGGNRALAARILGVSRRTLYYKLAEHSVS